MGSLSYAAKEKNNQWALSPPSLSLPLSSHPLTIDESVVIDSHSTDASNEPEVV